MRYFLGFLTVAWVFFAGTLPAQDFTVFGGFQHPGTLTLGSAVDSVGSAVGVPPGTSPGDFSGFRIDSKDFGIFGVRLHRSAAPLGLEHTVAYSPNFIDSDGNAFFYNTNLRLELPAPMLAPYATAGVGLFHAGGDSLASFGTKFSFNYGGGLKIALLSLIGLCLDVRMHSIRGVEDHTLNVLESSVGVFVGF